MTALGNLLRRAAPAIVRDGVGLGGVAAIVAGVAMVSDAAAMIVGGAAMVAVSFVWARSA